MFLGINYMHENMVIHRDLKSANVMLTVKAEIKLIDFGLCGDARTNPRLKGMVGSPYWMPPEVAFFFCSFFLFLFFFLFFFSVD
jgi:serine/threonine protein kinase